MGRWAWRAWHGFHWLGFAIAMVGPPVALVATGTLSLIFVLAVYGLAAVLFGFFLWLALRRTQPQT